MTDTKRAMIGLDDIFGDLFGLNIKGMRSIVDVWIKPATYAKAARDEGWEGRYTPSIRLWLSMMAVGSFLQFLWISDDAPITKVFAEGFRDAGLSAPEGITLTELGQEAAVWTYGLMPVVQLVFLMFLAVFWRLWGAPTTVGLRVRYLLGVMIPSGSLMLAILPVLAVMPEAYMTAYGLLLAVLAALVDWQTSARGFITAKARGGKLLRALALAVMIFVVNVGVSIIVQVAGVIIVANKYGLSPA
ncbi:hypothetical protein HK107_05760 [Parvularcula sp. ZS-1/3]|uniref:DUF3667 domain-containing protein n=1 Tax=Parvularcula mediterranea TaxID=2732508 RepID=A0A7Y3RLK0_9PROT|nr:hypothetical protein [Parvularcula mediterranea]NNU15825.1 hypothetical protein [Parvularcula mediterranea]